MSLRSAGQVLRAALMRGALMLVAASPAFAAPELIVNGNFEQVTAGGDLANGSGQVSATDLVGWVNGKDGGSGHYGYNFLYKPGTVDTTGATGFYYGNMSLWGANNGGTVNPGGASQNTGSSPAGGNVLAADGAFEQQAVSQTVNGLVAGTQYLLTFWWAAGQQSGFSGATTEMWNVSFGSRSFQTATVTTPSHGFTPWMLATILVTADAASDTLSFLAAGTPGGQPPFSLLDGVSLVAAPEPAAWGTMLAGLAALAALRRRWDLTRRNVKTCRT